MNKTQSALFSASALAMISLPSAAADDVNRPINVSSANVTQVTKDEAVLRVISNRAPSDNLSFINHKLQSDPPVETVKRFLTSNMQVSYVSQSAMPLEGGIQFVKPYTRVDDVDPNVIANKVFSPFENVYPYADSEKLRLNFGAQAAANQWTPSLTVIWDGIKPDTPEADKVLTALPVPGSADYAVTIGVHYNF